MQIYTLGSNAPLLPPQSVEDSFVLSLYNVTGSGAFDLLPNNRANRVLAVEPGTHGIMYVDSLRIQKTPGTQTVIQTTFNNALVFFNCNRDGVLGVFPAAPAYGTPAAPETLTAVANRSNFIGFVAVNRAGSTPPYVRVQGFGNANTSNYISNVRVITSSHDGA